MFIDNVTNSTSGAPAERNVSGDGEGDALQISLRWSEKESFDGRAFYKHLAPSGANRWDKEWPPTLPAWRPLEKFGY